mgnify:CR=1 FL=1
MKGSDVGQFIVLVYQHAKFGWIASSYRYERVPGRPFFQVGDKLSRNHPDYPDLTAVQKDLVRWSEDFSDEAIVSRFGKKRQTIQQFYEKLSPEYLKTYIIPFLEKKLRAILDAVRQHAIPLYQSSGRPKNVFPDDLVTIQEAASRTIFNFIRKEQELLYYLSIRNLDKELKLHGRMGHILVNEPAYLLIDSNLYYFNDIDGKKLLPFFQKQHIEIPAQVQEKYLSTFVLNAIRNYEVRTIGFSVREIRADLSIELSLEYGLDYQPGFAISFHYPPYFKCRENSDFAFQVKFHWNDGAYYFEKIMRDLEAEDSAIQYLKAVGMVKHGDWFWLEGKDRSLSEALRFIRNNRSDFEERGIRIKTSINNQKINLEEAKVQLEVVSKIDWFDIRGVVRFGDFEFPFQQLRKYILSGNQEFLLPDGSIGIIPDEWFLLYEDLFQYAKQNEGKLMLNRHHLHLVPEYSYGKSEQLYALLQGQDEGRSIPESVSLPKALQADLRRYQQLGYEWLYQLHRNRLGACLADDMGLGKTLQALSLLSKVYEEKPLYRPSIKKDGLQLSLFHSEEQPQDEPDSLYPSLIVLPTSLIHNWANELQRFTPHLRFLVYHGIDRQKRKQVRNQFYRHHVVLTSYGTLRNEIEALANFPFHVIILDEAQQIKNPESKIYASVIQLQANQRIILTGTPIENSLQDLWAQFNFMNPGFLGNYPFFKKRYLLPIEKGGNEKQTEKLKTLIQPFLLRRTKGEVASDLPPLTIQTRYCTMEEEQWRMYQEYKQAFRNSIVQLQEQHLIQQSGMLLLKGILHLRQLANHPLLVDSDYQAGSGKTTEVIDLLENLRSEGHKVLLFSSFVKHLELFERNFLERSWKYSKLTGSTVNREQVIAEFQSDPDRSFFLLSIKAGGVGLNLTEADYVVILDPWWNPAVEMQAINRAHRIGQDKPVIVYRFLSEASIEEKIHQLQEKKSKLIETFINENDPFSGVDLQELIRLVE